MEGFKKYLGSIGLTTQQAGYYLAWVRQYAQFCDDRQLDYWAEESLQDYLLENGRLNANWKVVQSEDAIRQYMYWRKGKKEMLFENLLSKFKEVLQSDAKSEKTKCLYSAWVNKFLKWSDREKDWGIDDFRAYVNKIVLEDQVSVSTQNQVIASLKCFYEKVLFISVGEESKALRARKKTRLPMIMSREMISEIFSRLNGVEFVMVKMLYGCGLRSGELYKLRVGDIDFGEEVIRVVDGSGKLKRENFLPVILHKELKNHLKWVKELYENDYKLGIADNWSTYYLFPALDLHRNQQGLKLQRKCFSDRILRRKFSQILDEVGHKGVFKLASFRDSFAVHYLEDGGDIRTLQKLLGHQKVGQTMIYNDLTQLNKRRIRSPLDNL